MSKTLHITERIFRELEEFLELEKPLLENSVAEAFESLKNLCDDQGVNESVKLFSSWKVKLLNDVMSREKNENSKESLLEFTVKNIVYRLFSAAVHRYEEDKRPYRHHWIPMCYTKHFSANRGKNINFKSYPIHGKAVRGVVPTQTYFVHEYSSKTGFYEDQVEYFFSIIESNYSGIPFGEFNDLIKIKYRVYLATFFFTQAIRHPDPKTAAFEVSTFKELVEQLFKMLETIGDFYVSLGKSKHLAFTPFIPTRVRKEVNGNSIYYFPATKDIGVLVSTQRILVKNVKKIIEACNSSTMNQVKKSQGVIFGNTFVDDASNK